MLTKGAFRNPINDQRRIRNPINDQRRRSTSGGGVPLARVSPLAPKDLFFTSRINEVPLVINPVNGKQRNLSGFKGIEESIGTNLIGKNPRNLV